MLSLPPDLCICLQRAIQALTAMLPPLPDVQQQLHAALGPPLDALGYILQQAGQAAVNTTALISQNALTGIGRAVGGVTRLLVDAQWQVWLAVHFSVLICKLGTRMFARVVHALLYAGYWIQSLASAYSLQAEDSTAQLHSVVSITNIMRLQRQAIATG